MKTYTIDGANFNGVETFYTEVQRVFSFPDYFGRNLDALYDELMNIDEPFEIVWLQSEKSRQEFSNDSSQPTFFSLLRQTLKDVSNCTLRLE